MFTLVGMIFYICKKNPDYFYRFYLEHGRETMWNWTKKSFYLVDRFLPGRPPGLD